MSLGVNLLLLFFLKISSICFFHRSLGYIVSGFWSLKGCSIRIPNHGVGLKTNQIFIGYSHDLCATQCTSVSYRQDTNVDQRICGWVGVYVSPSAVVDQLGTKHADI